MSFLPINLNSIRFRVTFLILVLAVFLSVSVGNTLYHNYIGANLSARNQLRNELSNHLNIAAGIQAMERGVGNTIIGGDLGLLKKFQDLGVEGDRHVNKAKVVVNEIMDQGFISIDFKDKFAKWSQSYEKLRETRPLIKDGAIGSAEWFGITTDNILMEFDLQDSVFVPIDESESVLYYNSSLRPNIALLAEYAGRERAIIGNTIAVGSEISKEKRITLERYRSHVDRAIRQIRVIRDNVSTTQELKKAIIHFEKIFLGSFEELRHQIFEVSDTNKQIDEETQSELEKAREMVLDQLHGIENQLSGLTNNVHLTEQVKRKMSGNSLDLLRVNYVFQDLANIEGKYRQVRYLDDKGWEQLRVDYINGQNLIVAENDLQDKSDRYYFTDSKDLPQGKIYLSPLDLNVERGRISVPFVPMLRFASPVFIDGQRHGVVVLNVNADHFLNDLPDGAILADREGYYLHHPDPGKEWGMMDALDRGANNLRQEFPEFADIMLTGSPEEIEVGNKAFFVQPVYYHPDNPDKFWVLLLVRDLVPFPVSAPFWIEKATEAINSALEISHVIGRLADVSSENNKKMADQNMLVSGALAVVMTFFIIIFFRELFMVGRKTEAINKELSQLTFGDLSRRIKISGDIEGNEAEKRPLDEIDLMGVNINKMAASLERSMAALQESEQRFRDYASTGSEWFWECDENLRFSYFSSGFKKATGIGPAQYLDKTREEIASPDGDEILAFQAHFEDLNNHKPFQNFQYKTTGVNGEQLTLRVSGKPVFAGDVFAGYRGTGSNVTKFTQMGAEIKIRMQEAEETRHRMEEQAVLMVELAEEQAILKNRAEAADHSKSEFLATMSHEIRTPMTGVLGMADLALNTRLTAKQRKYLDIIKDSGEALLTILNDILDFSKLEAGKLFIDNVDFHLPTLLEEIISLLGQRASEKGLDLSYEIDPDIPEGINSDPGRVRQMLFNLIGNAIKFTDAGKVEISVSQIRERDNQFLLTFEVKDSGIGISEEAQGRLFDKFEQADASTSRIHGGTGLGLAICKMLSELMGGTVGLKSKEGEGSTFWFSIRGNVATSEVSRKFDSLAISDFTASRQLKLLLAEDNQVNQMFISTLLSTLGHSVDIAQNGHIALQMVQKGNYDVLLSDIRMPVMDGMVLATSIRELEGKVSNIPIIGVTADAMTDHQKQYIAAGMDEISMKPINLSDLLQKIDIVLNEVIHTRIVKESLGPEDISLEADEPPEETSPEIDNFLKKMQAIADKYDGKK